LYIHNILSQWQHKEANFKTRLKLSSDFQTAEVKFKEWIFALAASIVGLLNPLLAGNTLPAVIFEMRTGL
jgi:hypothetical protein